MPRDAETRSRLRGGESAKTVAVVVVVRERDKRLVAAAVMPAQVRGAEARREAFVEDALEILRLVLVVSSLALLEEISRRHLLRIADDHALLRARNDADRVPHGDLRRLVENDEIECRFSREILRDRQGAHEEARLDAPDDSARLREQAAYRLLARLLRALAADDPELASVWAVAKAS